MKASRIASLALVAALSALGGCATQPGVQTSVEPVTPKLDASAAQAVSNMARFDHPIAGQ